MIKDNVKIIRDYYSGERAKNIISGVINFNRVQASTGYREAAYYCEKILRDSGIDASVLSYPANDKTNCYTVSMFKEWDCKGAYLDLISPERVRLADYDVNAMSLLQRSWGADYRDEDLEVVYLNRGKEKEKYDDIDLKGKLIFVTGEYWEYAKWAVGERGAVGVIIDNMPDLDGVKQRSRLYDATNVTSISGRRLTEDMRMFGFILTPRLGDRLRRICESMEDEHIKDNTQPRYPKVRAYVDARSYDGHLEDVTALIPGETDEEIIISAHLCHVKACANDNSSGVAASMEAIKTISDLINSGRLRKPKRSIRLLLVPELSGTYAYLSGMDKARISKIKAGVNLDMVGAPQINGSGTIMVGDVPNSAPSFVIDAAELILSEIKKEVDFFENGEYLSTFNAEMKDYMVGSDHYVFSDPTIGVPSIAISQWPDGVYHTSADTIENIDAAILERTGSLCAAYAYTMATLSADDVKEILVRMRSGFLKRLCAVAEEHGCQHNSSSLKAICEEIMHYKNVYIGRVEDIGRFFTGSEATAVRPIIEEQKAFLQNAAEEYFQQYLALAGAESFDFISDECETDYQAVPVRIFIAPLAEGKEFAGELGERQKKLSERYPDYFFISDYIINWIDGKRSIADIAAGVAIEGKLKDREFVRDYIMLLCDAKYAVIRD